MPIARIKTVPPDQAKGEVRQMYDTFQEAMGMVPNVFQAMSASPPILASMTNLIGTVLLGEGSLARTEKEMIAVVVSAANSCHY